jgi:hypothetical protein
VYAMIRSLGLTMAQRLFTIGWIARSRKASE